MKKMWLLIAVAAVMVFCLSSVSFADVFTASATMPTSTVTFNLYRITPGTPAVWTKVTDSSITFGNLTLDTVNNIYTSTTYYAVECSKSGGDEPTGSTRKIQMSYGNELVPTGQTVGKGLGVKCIRTAVRVTSTGEDATPLQKTNLGAAASSVLLTAVNGGWLRIYVGIYTGSPTVTGAEVFTAKDIVGSYSGQLTVTLLSA